MHEVTQAAANNEDGVHGVVHVSECGPGFIFPAHTWNVQGAFVRGVLEAVLLAWPCYPAWGPASAVAALPPAAGCRRQGVFMVPIWDVSPRASCRRERRGTWCSVLIAPVGAAAL